MTGRWSERGASGSERLRDVIPPIGEVWAQLTEARGTNGGGAEWYGFDSSSA